MALCSKCASPMDQSAAACVHCGQLVPATPAGPVSREELNSGQLPMSAAPALAGGEPLPLPPQFRYVDPLEGLGGWLILVAIGLVVAPLLIMFTVLSVDIPLLFGDRARDYLSLHQGLTAVVAFETLTNIVL